MAVKKGYFVLQQKSTSGIRTFSIYRVMKYGNEPAYMEWVGSSATLSEAKAKVNKLEIDEKIVYEKVLS